jgi:hypothetical protein
MDFFIQITFANVAAYIIMLIAISTLIKKLRYTQLVNSLILIGMYAVLIFVFYFIIEFLLN